MSETISTTYFSYLSCSNSFSFVTHFILSKHTSTSLPRLLSLCLMSHCDRLSVHLPALCLHWAAEQHRAGCTSGMQPLRSLPFSSFRFSPPLFFLYLLHSFLLTFLLVLLPSFPFHSSPTSNYPPICPINPHLHELPSSSPVSFLSPPNLHSPSPSPFSIPSLKFREHCPSSFSPPHSPVTIPSPPTSPHFSVLPPSFLSNPNKPGRTFLCGCRRNTTCQTWFKHKH